MDCSIHQIDRYLHDVLGIRPRITAWSGGERLPYFLREMYEFAQADLLGIPVLLIVDRNRAEQSPAAVRKHIDLLRTKQDADVIYVRAQLTTYNRKRLIEQKIPFIVPGNQMYLPMLAIDLRERFRSIRSEIPSFSPAAQVVVIHALLHAHEEEFAPSELAQKLGYTSMTIGRVFHELEAVNLGEATARGRERCLRFTGGRQEIWNRAQPFLRSPVKKRLFVRRTKGWEGGILAGLTALAQYSMLAPPPYVTYALSREDWKRLGWRYKDIGLGTQDPDAYEIEVWRYSPTLLSENDIVDPLSLYLSIKSEKDERTEGALDEMIRKLEW